MATNAPTSDISDDSGRLPRLSRRVTVVLSVALVALLVVVLVWQWRTPRAFYDQGNITGMYSPVGTTALVGIGETRRGLDPQELTIHAVEPQVVRGETAEIDVLVCHLAPGDGGLGTGRGRDLDRFCADHEPAEGAVMNGDDQLLLRVRSDEPGRVVVRGVEVTYSHGWRRGTQLTGTTARLEYGTETVQEHLGSG